MVGTRAATTRRRSARFAQRFTATESPRRPALGCILAQDGPGRRPIEVSERNFFAELKRRNVYKVVVAYAIVGWLLVQVATQVFPFFEIPNWAVRLVVLAIVIGFPIALVIAWAFELTPEGLKRTEDVDLAAAAQQPRHRAWIVVVIIAGAMSLGLFMLGRYGFRENKSLLNETSAKSIAVLPFVNMSADKADEYLSDGVSEELITALSKITGLQVKARTSSFAFKGKNEDIQKIGELLHVSHLLEGSVAKAGNKLRITAQLIQASDGNHLWSETYDRDMQDIFAVRSEVAQKVAAILKVRLLGEDKKQLDKKPTENLEAYNLYRQGRYYGDQVSEEGIKKALPFFEQAIQKDPRFALAYAGMADTYVAAADAFIAPREAFSKAKEAALKAIELDDTLAEAHASLGLLHYHYDWDWAAAEKEFKRALVLNSQSAWSYAAYSQFLGGMGRVEEANEQGRRALELDPLSVTARWCLGWAFLSAGRSDEAIEELSKAMELDPNSAWARTFLGRAYLSKGMQQRGIEELEKARHDGPDDAFVLGLLGYGYAVTGRRADALKVLQRFDEMEKHRYVSRAARVYVYAGLGDKDKAFEWLEKAYQERSDALAWFRQEPESKSLRTDPRFAVLMRKIGFTER